MPMFLVKECKRPLKTGIKLYKTAIFILFYPPFLNVKDSEMGFLLDIMIEINCF
jgi:hypothetical protein